MSMKNVTSHRILVDCEITRMVTTNSFLIRFVFVSSVTFMCVLLCSTSWYPRLRYFFSMIFLITFFGSLRRGPGANIQDNAGYSALHYAALNGHGDCVRLLLAHEALPNLPDSRGSSPLHLAAWAGHQEIVKLLLTQSNRPANPNLQVNYISFSGSMHYTYFSHSSYKNSFNLSFYFRLLTMKRLYIVLLSTAIPEL